MKRIILFFAVCLGLSVSQTAFADTSDTARSASRRTNTAVVSTGQSSNRSVATGAKRSSSTQNTQKAARTTAQNQQKVVSRTTQQQTTTPRTTAKTQPAKTGATRVATTSRTTPTRNANTRSATPINSRAVKTATPGKRPTRSTVRAADLDDAKITNIKSLNYSKCKTVYYECMDEFCANKDTNLRRCACSSRIHEFDGIKKQLENAEDKMLDFNQRLLTVSLDKEDAAAINVATEGELSFNKKDTSESEKLLQKITKTLNNSGDSRLNNNLSSISLSLDMDSAWDNVDSISGISTSSKNGLDLYNAARPVCVAMAKEVCSDDELNIAQNGYKLTIQQDCDTVAKSYKTQYNSAMNKIYESGALLDMARLNVYQQSNSDDTLTCKKKILDQLSDASVCGESLYRCLDTTGQYIDPSNGSAFLSPELYNLTNLLLEPDTGEKWSSVSQNADFIKFLNSKKEFLKPAIEQCKDISDMIWKEFLDDALAQIKLAQNAKLEEVKHSCTTLVAECKTSTLSSLADFDARALSTFSVSADKTVNAVCSEITTSCTNLMNVSDTDRNWETGMSNIAHDETLKTVIEECTNIGRNCIIQQCNATAGNFALCQDQTSDIRIRILLEKACYTDVENCIANADNINSSEVKTILKEIWGECIDEKINKTGSTLLAWLATNTGIDSCSTTGCYDGYTMNNGICEKVLSEQTDDTTTQATSPKEIVYVTDSFTNRCENKERDMYGNCCVGGKAYNGICVPGTGWKVARLQDLSCPTSRDTSNNLIDPYLCPVPGTMTLYCITSSSDPKPIIYYADTAEYECSNGMWIIVDSNGNYMKANPDTEEQYDPVMYYRKKLDTEQNVEDNTCVYGYMDNNWGFHGGANCTQNIQVPPTDNEFLIEYKPNN